MERGLQFFGGVAEADIFDNMKRVVLSHTPHATVFKPRFLEYARVRGFAAVACNPRRGNEKGRVERPIGFVRSRFWPGRRFVDLLDLNAQTARWRDDVANHRVHAAPPLRLGDPDLDALSLREPDLALYDALVPTPMTRDSGPSLSTPADQEPADDQAAHERRRFPRPVDPEAARVAPPRYGAARREPARQGQADNLTDLEILHRLCDEERGSRLESAVDRRVRDATFPEVSTVDGFDFDRVW